MPSAESISEEAIRDHINIAVKEVFLTMLGQHVEPIDPAARADGQTWPPIDGQQMPHSAHVVGTVGFIGEANGLIYLYLPEPFARIATSRLLGMKEAELAGKNEEVVNDAVGELTNMTVGVFKNKLCDSGFSCRLTIPSILRGSNFTIEPVSSAARRTFYFSCAGHRLVADILMKIGE